MSILGKLCSLLTLVIAILLGGLFSGEFARLGLVRYYIENIASSDRPKGLWPSSVDLSLPHWSYDDIEDGELNGKVALVTGANGGLGFETAMELAIKGATVVVGCRDSNKCHAACAKINQRVEEISSQGKAIPMIVDVSSFDSVKRFIGEFKEKFSFLDIFVQNAGIPSGPNLKLTLDGIERTFHTNHVGHFQMTMCLKELIENATSNGFVRIVVVSSGAHFGAPAGIGVWTTVEEINSFENYQKYDYYSVTKFANVLFARGLSKRLLKNSENIIATSVHPGMVATGIWEGNVAQEKIESWELPPWIKDNILFPAFRSLRDQVMWTASQGAWTQTYLATQVPKSDSGKYFHPINRQVSWHEMANDDALEKRFWDFSLHLVEGQC